MSSLLMSRRDIEFLLYEWLNVEDLASFDRFSDHERQTFDAVLDLSEALANDHFLTHNKLADQNEPRFVDGRVELPSQVSQALKVFAEAGLFAATADYDLGGMQLPATVSHAATTYFNAANIATMAYPFLTIAAANLLKAHGSPEQIDLYVRPMLQGRYFGTMCLSEPQAGSSLADIATRAVPQGDGVYRLFGRKMWISAGEHDLSDNIIHLVLAKAPGGGEGVRGLSLFVVPKFLVGSSHAGQRNDVVLAGLNHKMGYRGAVNALLNFGEGEHCPGGEAGAVGYLVGEPHHGLAYMFHMMNEARVKVGLGASALGYTGYLHALAYARDRPQGRPIGAKTVGEPQSPIISHTDVRRMLLAQKVYAEGGLALGLYCARLIDLEAVGDEEARAQSRALLDVLTPVAKSWPSQWCLAANDLAIQVHGGYGYTRDYNVEQFYRDNRLNAIHEGTHGIQALDLLGRKVVQNAGSDLACLWRLIDATCAAAATAGGDLALWAERLASVRRDLEITTSHLSGQPLARGLANASVYLEVFGHVVMAWTWLQQALAADGKSGDFYEGKRQACRYFMDWELPRTGPQLALLARIDTAALDMRDVWF